MRDLVSFRRARGSAFRLRPKRRRVVAIFALLRSGAVGVFAFSCAPVRRALRTGKVDEVEGESLRMLSAHSGRLL